MLFRKKTSAEKVAAAYLKHTSFMGSVASMSPIAHNARFEVLPMAYVVCDHAGFSAHAICLPYRKAILDEVERLCSHSQDKLKEFFQRVDLYRDVLKQGEIRADWMVGLGGGSEILSSHPVLICCGVLGDILTNPVCTEDYYAAPFYFGDLGENFRFTNEVMDKIVPDAFKLSNEVYSILSK